MDEFLCVCVSMCMHVYICIAYVYVYLNPEWYVYVHVYTYREVHTFALLVVSARFHPFAAVVRNLALVACK